MLALLVYFKGQLCFFKCPIREGSPVNISQRRRWQPSVTWEIEKEHRNTKKAYCRKRIKVILGSKSAIVTRIIRKTSLGAQW